MNLILFGFKSCGKTYFGNRLSEALKRPFVDTDQWIEETYFQSTGEKSTCRAIHQRLGDVGFRALESKALEALQAVNGSIIAVGGGAVLEEKNLKILQALGELVYLSIDKEALWQRMLSSLLPSYLDPADPEGSFERMYAERKSLYEKIPAVHIELASRSDEEILTLMKTSFAFCSNYGK